MYQLNYYRLHRELQLAAINYPVYIRKKHVKTSHHTKFWSHWKLVPSHHFGVNIYLFQHICLITPFDVWSHHLELGSVTITCDGTVYCWSHHKTCSSHHRHFVHTIRCASHHIPCVTPARYHHTVFVWSYQDSMNHTIESGSHRIVLSTRVTWFTPRLYLHTEVVHVHTRNKFIHTEIEQTIPYSIHITLTRSFLKLERRPSSPGLDHGWCVYSKLRRT